MSRKTLDCHDFCSLVLAREWRILEEIPVSPRILKRRLMAERRRARGGSLSEQEGSERRLRDQVMWNGWQYFGMRVFHRWLRKWRKWNLEDAGSGGH